jgi:hypothetical protein
MSRTFITCVFFRDPILPVFPEQYLFVGFENFCPSWPQNSVQDATCTGFARRLKAYRENPFLK